jgi:hypothetical protein
MRDLMTQHLIDIYSDSGRGGLKKQALGLFFMVAAFQVAAAPLDALLTATPERTAPNGYLELGSDHMNQALDFFKIRDTDALAAGTQAGDYHGAYVSGGWRLRDNIWLTGGLWQRNISGLSENYNFNSWQVSGLYRFMEADGKLPALAFRVSAWGNYSGQIGATFPSNAGVNTLFSSGTELKSIKVVNPADKSLQIDLIGTWKPSSSTDLGLLLGAGSTELSYDALTGSVAEGGLLYDFRFIGNKLVGVAANGSEISKTFNTVSVADELAWRGNFLQFGFNGAWSSGPWTLRGGYLYYAIQREGIDDILAARGWSSFTQSKNLILEANYRFSPRVSAFVRGQLSTSLIFNDMPVLYNSYSADLFGGRYSIYSVGLRAEF